MFDIVGIMGKIKIYKEKFLKTVKNLLTEGVTPEKLGITVMLGFIVGIIPVLGINTFILAAIALRWRLNMVIIQIINYAVYPLQIMFLVPFYKAGQWVFRTEATVNITISDYIELFSTNFFKAASEFSFMILRGMSVWFLISIPVGIIIYSIFVSFFKNLLIQVASKRR